MQFKASPTADDQTLLSIAPEAATHYAQSETPVCATTYLRFEIRRKVVHMLPGLIPFIMWFIYHEDPLPAWNLAVAVAVVSVLTLIGISYPHARRRDRHENWSRTCRTYAVGPLLILILFPGNAEYAATVLTVLAFGDSAAALGGRLLGRKRLFWNHDKTYMGLFCFIICAAPLGSLAYWGEANPQVPLVVVVFCGTFAAILAGIAESLRSRIDDNLRVSGAAAVGVIVASWIMLPAV